MWVFHLLYATSEVTLAGEKRDPGCHSAPLLQAHTENEEHESTDGEMGQRHPQ